MSGPFLPVEYLHVELYHQKELAGRCPSHPERQDEMWLFNLSFTKG